MAPRSNRNGNGILAALSADDRARVEPHLEPVTLKVRERLEAANRNVKIVYFITSGLGSVVAIGRGGQQQSEVGIIGREGMTGIAVILGADRSPHETIMQLEGAAQSIAAEGLSRLMNESRSLSAVLLRYAHVFGIQAGHTALANARAKLEERLARWLLMAHDRIDGDELHLTHDFLALMLGTTRPGVTVAVQELEAKGLITTARSSIRVRDRDGLIASANGCYGVPEAEMKRLFPAT